MLFSLIKSLKIILTLALLLINIFIVRPFISLSYIYIFNRLYIIVSILLTF